MPGQNDLWPWLQSIMQNQGAGAPNSIGGMPRYGTGPGDLGMGDPTGLTANTPGAPSMGYPAMGRPGQPAAPMQNFGNFNPPPGPGPGNVAPVDLSGQPPSPPSLWSMRHGMPGNPLGGHVRRRRLTPLRKVSRPMQATLSALETRRSHLVLRYCRKRVGAPFLLGLISRTCPGPGSYQGGGIGGDWRFPTAVAPGQGGIGSDARFPLASPPGSPSATPKPAGATPTGPLASSGGGGAPMKRTPGAPNLGYYQPNNRFIGIAQPNASPQNSMRAGPQATALNLAGLFGGRGQPAAAPAVNPNVPAANAQPVSSASPPAAQSNAPWNIGPLQRGRRWNPNSNDYSP